MKNYIGCKIIKAEEKTYGGYRHEKYDVSVSLESSIPEDTKGYIVIYPPIGNKEEKPHISWCPKDVFEKAYRIIENAEISLII